MNKPKLLWVGDLVANTGFARVSHNLLTRINDAFDLVVLASNYHGDPHDYPFKIYPATNRFASSLVFGELRIREIVLREKPDIVFCINDSWILNDLYNHIKDLHKNGEFKFVGYYPVDGINWFNVLSITANDWDDVFIYTMFGCEEAAKAGLTKNCMYLPHGVDKNVFYPMDKKECRNKLGIPENAFIVFNGNRNQPRKRIDLTIKGFAEFAQNAPDAILYLHMGAKDLGWPIKELFAKEMSKRELNPSKRLILTNSQSKSIQNVTDNNLREIYNVADIGVNTCEGEGWGLVNFEHAACRVAQVVPNHTSCKEIFGGHGDLIDVEHMTTDKDFGREMFCISYKSLSDILFKHYLDREYNKERATRCFNRVSQVIFEWDSIASALKKTLLELHNTAESSLGFANTQKLKLNKKIKSKKQKS